MDRIQKALDKAKASQDNVASSDMKSKSTEPKIKHNDPLAPAIPSIAYTQTRVVETSQQQLEEKRVIAGTYTNPQSAVFRMLRTQILQKMRTNDWQTLAITSPTAGEGKSLISANLAVAMAMELNQTVLLVDMDMRNPSIKEYFSLDIKKGLRNYLEEDLELSDVLINPGVKGMVILPGVGRAENSAELLSSPKMARLVEDLKAQYDSRMIIFDVPPIMQTDDVLLASNYFDCTLLVLEDGKNKEAEITKSMQLLENHNLIGTVVNKSENPPKHQNY
ncbi:MAG TPA: polysaccharide biosynthesis tyrosine autokinase [Methylophaga sp.]|nr:polysaccharide biosynthesis tyrosine autokinase [Methylophaga sp.]